MKEIAFGSFGVLALAIASSLFFACSLAFADAPEPVPGNKKFTGDYDKMVETRFVRVLVPYSKTFYFLDGATFGRRFW